MSTLSFSSITKKIIMSLVGLFLSVFLVVHLSINITILLDDSREMFNSAAHFMATNPLIQTFQWVLFAGFVLHIVLGVVLQVQNWLARPVRYKVKGNNETSFFSKFMIHTGIIVLVFLGIHLVNFFFKVKMGEVPEIVYTSTAYIAGNEIVTNVVYEDMGLLIINLFSNVWYVVFYVLSLLLLGFHLHHGVQSAFQSLGLNHPIYTPVIKGFGWLFTIVITAGFIVIPLFIYFG